MNFILLNHQENPRLESLREKKRERSFFCVIVRQQIWFWWWGKVEHGQDWVCGQMLLWMSGWGRVGENEWVVGRKSGSIRHLLSMYTPNRITPHKKGDTVTNSLHSIWKGWTKLFSSNSIIRIFCSKHSQKIIIDTNSQSVYGECQYQQERWTCRDIIYIYRVKKHSSHNQKHWGELLCSMVFFLSILRICVLNLQRLLLIYHHIEFMCKTRQSFVSLFGLRWIK